MVQEKKEYQKPVLERLVLIPKENVLAVCFDITGSTPWPDLACQNEICFGVTLAGPSLP